MTLFEYDLPLLWQTMANGSQVLSGKSLSLSFAIGDLEVYFGVRPCKQAIPVQQLLLHWFPEPLVANYSSFKLLLWRR